MKPTLEIPLELLENDAVFENSFFKRFDLRHAPEPIELQSGLSKNYLFPTFYSNATNGVAVHLCSYEKAAQLMPHPKMKPVRMPGGRAVVTFSSYVYRNVMGVPPYNEIVWTIPVIFDGWWSLPALPMIAGALFPGFGYWVVGMPVTSKENQLRGNQIWGLPKVTQEVEIFEEDGMLVNRAKEENGEVYIEFKVPMTGGKKVTFDTSMSLYSKKGDSFLESETAIRGEFNLVKYMDLLFKRGKKPERQTLTIGKSSSAKVLNELEIEPHPFQFRYTDDLDACFDLAKKEIRS